MSNGMNSETVRIWKEVVFTCFNSRFVWKEMIFICFSTLSQLIHRETEKNLERTSVRIVSNLCRILSGTFQIQVWSATLALICVVSPHGSRIKKDGHML